jgi:TolB-like protein/AraC-like DNA-binding protein
VNHYLKSYVNTHKLQALETRSDFQNIIENDSSNPLIKKVLAEIEGNFRNENFSVGDLAVRLGMSRSQLHRRLKVACGLSANQFIRDFRLNKAYELLKNGERTVSEIAYEVGFGSPSYFTTCFTECYGYPPVELKFRLAQRINASEVIRAKNRPDLNWLLYTGIGLIFILLFFLAWKYFRNFGTERSARTIVQGAEPGSIVVLPFKNLSTNQEENEYFGTGIVEAINRYLSQIEGLRIISFTSASRYKDSGKSPGQIADELSVAYLLDGSIQRIDNQVRIEVKLINATDDNQVWAENYDRQFQDIFKTQSEIAERIAIALKATLSPGERELLNTRMTNNTEAYDLYLKGNYELSSYSRAGIRRATEFFNRAIRVDTAFALAYSGLAEAYCLMASIYAAELTATDALSQARQYIDKALDLNPGLAEAHAQYGFYLLYNNWDFQGAEAEYEKAIPFKKETLALYADLLNFLRRHPEAYDAARQLNHTDPFYPNSRMTMTLFYLGRSKEASEFAESRLNLYRNYVTWDNYGFLMLNTGRYEKAIEAFQNAMELEGFTVGGSVHDQKIWISDQIGVMIGEEGQYDAEIKPRSGDERSRVQ